MLHESLIFLVHMQVEGVSVEECQKSGCILGTIS